MVATNKNYPTPSKRSSHQRTKSGCCEKVQSIQMTVQHSHIPLPEHWMCFLHI